MLKLLFAILTVIDMVAINAAIEQPSPEAAQLGLMWLLYYSALVGWLIGFRAWKDCKGQDGPSPALLRLCAANSLIFAGVSAALHFSGKNPQEWLSLYLFMAVYLFRLAPLSAASIVISPFLFLSNPRLKALLALLVCQVCAWWGGYLALGQDPAWKESFLLFGMWAPNWGFGLMAGGLLLKPMLPRSDRPEVSSQ